MRCFHFSDDPAIAVFEPRPVRIPSERPPGREWLNGPLVWAIDAWHQPMYLFPRDCPRILTWPTPSTSDEDHARWWNPPPGRIVAYVEAAWLARLRQGVLYRYELPADAFEDLNDAGMRVARAPVAPLEMTRLTDLTGALDDAGVALRVVEDLRPLRALWTTTLHVSGIRLRNARHWNAPA